MPAQVCALYQTGDSHIAVYDFDRATMLVSFPSPSGFPSTGAAVVKAYDRPFTGNSPLPIPARTPLADRPGSGCVALVHAVFNMTELFAWEAGQQ